MQEQLSLFGFSCEQDEEVSTINETIIKEEGIKEDTPERRKLFTEQHKESLEKYPYTFVEYNPTSGNYFLKFDKKKWESENSEELQDMQLEN